MAYEKKPGDLSIFKNDRKEKDTHPDYRIVGLDLNGEKIRGALWLKKDRNGNTFMAGKIEPDTYDADKSRGGGGSDSGGGGEGRVAGRDRDRQAYDLNDDVPFIFQ